MARIVIGNGLSAAPADPEEGQLFYDQKANVLYEYHDGWYSAKELEAKASEPQPVEEPAKPAPKKRTAKKK